MFLNEVEAKQMLKAAGISVTDTRLATSRNEAADLSKTLGYPVVLKIVSPDVVHKSDAGGVKLGLETEQQVGNAYDEIISSVTAKFPQAKIQGVAVQKMAPFGTEMIIGMVKDSQFGATLMFGLGGIFVELLKDVSFRVTPVDRRDAGEMIEEIKGRKILTGFRGQPGVDLSALEDMLVKVSRFIETNPQITELDLNPVIAYPDGAIAVDARINVEVSPDVAIEVKKRPVSGDLDFLFYPRSVAVAGASNNPASAGYDFMQHLINFGYKGKIYPLSLKNAEVMGIKAYTSIEDIPGTVDHVIYCIDLERMPAFLDICVKKNVRSIHAFAARGAETGRAEAKKLEATIREKVREYGIRLLGPNCMGVYCPESGFSFCTDFLKEPGQVGALIQSGGSSTDIARYGALRGLRFSKLVSYGNAIDINEMDLLEYLCNDPQTKVIMAFIEGLRGNGRDFLDLVKKTSARKPFIVCKGGLSKAGARATMSHTASLAGSSMVWNTAIRQAGGIPVRDIDDLVNIAVAFSFLPPIRGRRIGTGGSGGGRNTVSVDEWDSYGFDVVPLPREVREEFRKRGAMLWDCLDNPADRSISVPGDAFTVPALLLEMAKRPEYDFICANIAADDHPYNQQTFVDWISTNVEGYIKLFKESPKPFFTIFSERPLSTPDMGHWFWKEVAHLRKRLIEEKVPFFPSVDKAAQAVNELIFYHQRKDRLNG
ncbi:MAG: acetate--CoA ligase family protein [Dehalococcoidales bacterium]|nr:acetate--CoA ligase family protein [Dehalococcoidales bacterium]